MDLGELKKKLAEILKKHPEVGEKMTGRIEINMNNGGITRIYVFKELK